MPSSLNAIFNYCSLNDLKQQAAPPAAVGNQRDSGSGRSSSARSSTSKRDADKSSAADPRAVRPGSPTPRDVQSSWLAVAENRSPAL